MINITSLPDAWEMVERLGGKEACEKDELYDIYYKISTAIFDYRLKYDLSQKKLAEKLGVTQPMVAKLESGDYNYTVEQLWKLATKLNFKLSIDFEEIKQNEYSVFSREEIQDDIADYEMDFLAVGS
ncbi:helix-turn-helix transcriptional regulator [Desulfosporosinus metallidurans]|uniref:Putative transcriptional regulator n=1 Tax=Desulfosporosinus metallidurans TaxID=1888891 RepID=A0A1Q8R0C3_9FIRM|nr:helix-turn-helix transcriptional regulator [Desulfosporosinus metallidurans]OLN33079.1 putative transcriptional regulator [Desulfosporosinus metallidurans]